MGGKRCIINKFKGLSRGRQETVNGFSCFNAGGCRRGCVAGSKNEKICKSQAGSWATGIMTGWSMRSASGTTRFSWDRRAKRRWSSCDQQIKRSSLAGGVGGTVGLNGYE